MGAFSHKFLMTPSAETTHRIKKVTGCKMVRAASITMPSGGDRGSRAGCRRKSVMCFCSFFVFLPALLPCDVTDVTVRTIPCRYCFYSVVQKYVFRPAGATHCPDKSEVWRGWADRAKFHVYRSRNVEIQPPKLSKLRILVINLPLRAHSFAQLLRNSQICTRL